MSSPSFMVDASDPIRRVLFNNTVEPTSPSPDVSPRAIKRPSDLVDGEDSEMDESVVEDPVDVDEVMGSPVIPDSQDELEDEEEDDEEEEDDSEDGEGNSFLDDECEEASESEEEPAEEPGFVPFSHRPRHVVDTTDDEERSEDENEDAGSLNDFLDDEDAGEHAPPGSDLPDVASPQSPEVEEELEQELEDLRDEEAPRRRRLVRKIGLIPSSPIASSPERVPERAPEPEETVSAEEEDLQESIIQESGLDSDHEQAPATAMDIDDPEANVSLADESTADVSMLQSPELVRAPGKTQFNNTTAQHPTEATAPLEDNRKRKRDSEDSEHEDAQHDASAEQPKKKQRTHRQSTKKRGKHSTEKRRQSLIAAKMLAVATSALSEEQKKKRKEEKKMRHKNKEARQLEKQKKNALKAKGVPLQERADSNRGPASRPVVAPEDDSPSGHEQGDFEMKGQSEDGENGETVEDTLQPALQGSGEGTLPHIEEENKSPAEENIPPADRSSSTINESTTPTATTPALLSPFRSTSNENAQLDESSIFPDRPPTPAAYPSSPEPSPRPATSTTPAKSTPVKPKRRNVRQPTKSPYFSTGPEAQEGRTPRGASILPWPPKDTERFGLIQEEFADRPFFVILVTIFLTKTKGSNAIPMFRKFAEAYPTPEALVEAPVEDLMTYFETLGLPQRANSIKNLATTWVQQPPVAGIVSKFAYKYPDPASTLPFPDELFEEPLGVPVGTQFEIGHLKGFGQYGMDSWRIFCRDELLGKDNEEWMHVVPNDKELRSYVRWKWSLKGRYWREEFDQWIPDLGVRRLEKALYPSQERALQERAEKAASKKKVDDAEDGAEEQGEEQVEMLEAVSAPVRRTRKKALEVSAAEDEQAPVKTTPARRTRKKAAEVIADDTKPAPTPARLTRKKAAEIATEDPEPFPAQSSARRTRKQTSAEVDSTPNGTEASSSSSSAKKVVVVVPTPARRTRKIVAADAAPTPLRRSTRVAAKSD